MDKDTAVSIMHALIKQLRRRRARSGPGEKTMKEKEGEEVRIKDPVTEKKSKTDPRLRKVGGRGT